MQTFSLQIGKTTKIFKLNLFEVNFQNLKFRHRLTASNLDTYFSGMLKISPGGLLTTLVYGGVRMKGQIQTQKYGSIKTAFPNFSASCQSLTQKYGRQILFLKPEYHQHLLKMFYTSSEMILNLTSVHYPGILSSRIPKREVYEKNLTQKDGKLLGKIRTQKYGLQTRFQTQKYDTYISVYECCKNPPPPPPPLAK